MGDGHTLNAWRKYLEILQTVSSLPPLVPNLSSATLSQIYHPRRLQGIHRRDPSRLPLRILGVVQVCVTVLNKGFVRNVATGIERQYSHREWIHTKWALSSLSRLRQDIDRQGPKRGQWHLWVFVRDTSTRLVTNYYLPLSWPGKRLRGFHPSTFTSSEPQTFPFAELKGDKHKEDESQSFWRYVRVEVPDHHNFIVTATC